MWRVLWWVSYLYTAKKTCLGAQLNSARCEKCKTFPTQDIGAENENDGKNI
jgi:hypothetical protein